MKNLNFINYSFIPFGTNKQYKPQKKKVIPFGTNGIISPRAVETKASRVPPPLICSNKLGGTIQYKPIYFLK